MKELIKNNLREAKPAFSLVEILIVLFIISLGLVGILSLIVQSIKSQDYNKNNLVAYQLSQEGVELVRRNRDSNWLSGYDFNFNLAEATGQVYNYCFDYNDTIPTASSEACVLRLDANGFYVHELIGLSSGFSRLISVELLEGGVTLKVNSIVSWQGREGKSEYNTEALLYDWR